MYRDAKENKLVRVVHALVHCIKRLKASTAARQQSVLIKKGRGTLYRDEQENKLASKMVTI